MRSGSIDPPDDEFANIGHHGYYWSSQTDPITTNNAYDLQITVDSVATSRYDTRWYAFPLRYPVGN